MGGGRVPISLTHPIHTPIFKISQFSTFLAKYKHWFKTHAPSDAIRSFPPDSCFAGGAERRNAEKRRDPFFESERRCQQVDQTFKCAQCRFGSLVSSFQHRGGH
jgi:hypothetical protein